MSIRTKKGVIMINRTTRLLDKAMRKHRLASDYKLALVMGVSQSSLGSYRAGKTLPDTRVISKICELTDDDSALIAVEIEAERAKSPEARKIWLGFAQRLQAGFSDVNLMVFIAIFSLAFTALPAWASGVFAYALSLRVCILCKVANWLFRSAAHGFVIVCKVAANVPSHATPAAVLLAR